MAEPVVICGGYIDGQDNRGHHANVDKKGNLWVREGSYDFDNKTYEDTSFVTGDSPQVHDFNADAGRNAVDGYIIVDSGEVQFDISRDGLTYGSKFTVKAGEKVNLTHFNIDKIRATWVSDAAYRINLI